MVAGTAPIVSDAFDTLKDALFAGLCWKSESPVLNTLGILSWIYLFGVHVYLFCHQGGIGEFAPTYAGIISIAPKSEEGPAFNWKESLLVFLFKQTTPAKVRNIQFEDGAQVPAAILYMIIEGGSPIVATLNIIVPLTKIAFAHFFNNPLGKHVGPWLQRQLVQAGRNGNKARTEALLATVYATDELTALVFQDVGSLANEMLGLSNHGEYLDLSSKNIRDEQAKALAEALKSNDRLTELNLRGNEIGDDGAKVPTDRPAPLPPDRFRHGMQCLQAAVAAC
eukprot:NODE_2160_length_984_cov_151.660926.p1 GENE.NODE_2160_length_984_cov_151.660926~~NODE_2160_length_984_cov_151.660926.p1  ORF type:complete len:292 (-),score=69.91 NODE_2160_length_984_cov_151.660926:91-933(-)